MRFRSQSLFLCLSAFLCSSFALAEEPKKDDGFRTGVAASSQRFSHAGAVDMSDNPVIDMTGKKDDAGTTGTNPVIGKITRARGSRCIAQLSNSSDDDYSVRYQILTQGADGKVARRESFSSSIGAKKTVSKSFICDRDQNMQVVLLSGKKRSKAGKADRSATPAAPTSPNPEGATAPARNSTGLKPFEPFNR